MSQKEYDDAVSAEAIGAADEGGARAAREARLNLEYTQVEAPVSGVTSRALPTEGTLVSGPNVLLTTVTQVDPIWVNFGIPDNEQARLRKDVEAGRLKLPKNGFASRWRCAWPTAACIRGPGKLDFTDVREPPRPARRRRAPSCPTRTACCARAVRARDPARRDAPNAVTVPQRAVLEGPQGKFVYVVDDARQGAPRRARCQVGDWAGDRMDLVIDRA